MLQNAFKSYVRTRDYCVTGKHIIQMCLNVIKVSIELGNYVHVNNYISKAEQTPEVQVSNFAVLSPADVLHVVSAYTACNAKNESVVGASTSAHCAVQVFSIQP